jgi:hypothetical protein
MKEFMTKALWIDFRDGKVREDIMSFPAFSRLMKLDARNDIQILVYQQHANV